MNNSSISVKCWAADGQLVANWSEVQFRCEASRYNVSYDISVPWDDTPTIHGENNTANTSLALPLDLYVPGALYDITVTSGLHSGYCTTVTPDESKMRISYSKYCVLPLINILINMKC